MLSLTDEKCEMYRPIWRMRCVMRAALMSRNVLSMQRSLRRKVAVIRSARQNGKNLGYSRSPWVAAGDQHPRNNGIEMISPHKSNRKKTPDGRRLRRYERSRLVERFFAWSQLQRRLLTRWEYYAENFLGFVSKSC